MIFNITIAIVIAYLLGSIPFAYIASRLKKGTDIRQMGGGNVGALNTMREIGPAVGATVLLADVAKGSLSVLIARWLGLPLAWIFVAGFVAIVGHNWPIFLKFRGGRGAATTMGVMLALVPIPFAISFAIIATVIIITSNVRLGTIVGLAFLPLIIWRFGGSTALTIYSVALPIFLGLRSLASFQGAVVASTGKRKSLIFDRDYHFWQARKNQ